MKSAFNEGLSTLSLPFASGAAHARLLKHQKPRFSYPPTDRSSVNCASVNCASVDWASVDWAHYSLTIGYDRQRIGLKPSRPVIALPSTNRCARFPLACALLLTESAMAKGQRF